MHHSDTSSIAHLKNIPAQKLNFGKHNNTRTKVKITEIRTAPGKKIAKLNLINFESSTNVLKYLKLLLLLVKPV